MPFLLLPSHIVKKPFYREREHSVGPENRRLERRDVYKRQVLACVLPVAAVLLAAAAIYFLVRTGLVLKRKLRRSPGGPEGEI